MRDKRKADWYNLNQLLVGDPLAHGYGASVEALTSVKVRYAGNR